MSFFISPAFADAGSAAAQQSPVPTIIMMVGMVAIFYFLLWRPQRKRQQEQQTLVTSLQKGDEIVFAGGLIGRIVKLDEDFVVVALNDTVEIKIQKSSVFATLPKGTIKNI